MLGGVALGRVLGFALSLTKLNLSSNQLCGLAPSSWSGNAIDAIAASLFDGGTGLTELDLSGNELCGMWADRIGGEPLAVGDYTTAGIDSLRGAFAGAQMALSILR